jgi:hypothetical protein
VGLYLNILLWVLAVLLFLLAVFFILPIRYELAGSYREAFFSHFLIAIKPFIELQGDPGEGFSFSLNVLGIPFKYHRGKHEKGEKDLKGRGKKKGKGKKKKGPSLDFGIFADREFIRNSFTFVRDALKLVGPKSLDIRGKVGFEDPCYNGCLAALNSFFGSALSIPGIVINLEPVWEKEYIDVSFSISGEIIVVQILFGTIKFLLAVRAWKIWKAIRASRRRAKLAVW